jgi:adenylate cyclase
MRRRLDYLIPLLVLLCAILLRYDDGAFVAGMRNRVFDFYQELQPRPYLQQPVRILDIDEDSLKRIGQWPWPRDVLARIVDRLTQAGAAAIALDILLAEPDRTSPESLLKQWQSRPDAGSLRQALNQLPDPDAELAAALSRGPTVVAFSLNQTMGGSAPLRKAGFATAGDEPRRFVTDLSGATVGLPALEQAAPGNGSVNVLPDPDGVIRRVPIVIAHRGEIYPSLVAEALRVAQGASGYVIKASGASGEESFGRATGLTHVRIGEAIVPVDRAGNLPLYDTGPRPERFIPAWKVLTPDFDPQQVAGHIILIGTSVEGLKDTKPTPLDPVMAGVEIHAQLLEQILGSQYLQRPDWASGAEILLLLALGLILILLLHRLGAVWSAAVTLAAIAAAVAGSWIAYSRLAMQFDPLYPSLAALAIYLSGSLLGYLRTEGERRNVRKAFGQYLTPVLVEELTRHPERLQLGGEMRELTLMFSDIQGFTRIAETLDPHELTRLINGILTPLTSAIQEVKGTIDKYIGDCVMAFWNAPLDDADHARNALRAALAMKKALAKVNAELAAEATREGRKPLEVAIGIGINTGRCSVGNMGSDQRFDYTALGDTVNLASRLEGLTRGYGVGVIVGEDTAAKAGDMPLIEIDRVQVKGRARPLAIYTLVGEARDGAFEQLAATQAKFLAAYRGKDWERASAALAACRGLAPELGQLYDLFARRIAEFAEAPPPGEWDGVYIATSKTG